MNANVVFTNNFCTHPRKSLVDHSKTEFEGILLNSLSFLEKKSMPFTNFFELPVIVAYSNVFSILNCYVFSFLQTKHSGRIKINISTVSMQ